MAITSTNPSTGERLKTFDPLTSDQIEKKLTAADRAFDRHRRDPFAKRALLMMAAASLLEQEKDRLGRIITLEMGKLLSASVEEILKCARGCQFYAENAQLAIMPWNFPFWQVFRFAAPAVMAGNVVLLKHAGNVPQCALAIEDVFRRAGLDEGIFQTLLIEAEQTRALIDDARVKAVTLTGSERAGIEVASAAARQIKKSVLELGGSDPFVVMPTADLEAAVDTGVKARMINTGQSCIAAKRFIVHEKIYEKFVAKFLERVRSLRLGDPLNETTEIGPLATEAILQGVDQQVQKTVSLGAKLLTGGNRVKREGFFYEPTVLTDIPRESPAFGEEVFGPVASIFRARDAADAIEIANSTLFGLGASVWTHDREEQELFASELEAGMVFINGMVVSDPRLPFGGVKRSGFGRELGAEGIREFVNIKTVVIA